MHLDLTPAQLDIKTRAAQFAAEHVRPVAAQRDNTDLFPSDELKQLADMGFMGVNVSSQFGGLEAGVVAYSTAITEVGAADASVGVTMSVNNMVCEVLEQFGTDHQKKTFIPRITQGEYGGGSFCLSEPGSGSDAAGMLTRADFQDDHWIIHGTKSWITTGAHAGVFLVWAKAFHPDHEDGPITAFVVDPATPGISVGKAEEKMGQHGSNTVTLNFDHVKVPADSVLGHIGKGFRIAMMALDGGRIGVASLAVGIAREAIQQAATIINTTPALSQDATVVSKIGELYQELQAAQQMVFHAATLKEKKVARFTREASMAKVFATETASTITEELVALLGPMGVLKDTSLERLVRDARVTRIYEGTSEIQRVVIARDLLKELA